MLAHEPLMMLGDRLVSLPIFLRFYVRNPGKHRLATKLRRLRTNLLRQTPDLGYWHQSGILEGVIERVLDPGTHNDAEQPDILEWLCGLYDMQCELAHDRIYSLLELAKDGSRIPVDYAMPLPELVHHILTTIDRETCVCELQRILYQLDINEIAADRMTACVYVEREEVAGGLCGDNQQSAPPQVCRSHSSAVWCTSGRE